MRVHALSPAQRRVLRTVVVGEATGRAIAISPDDARVRLWKLTSATESFGVAAPDAAMLAEVGSVPLSWSLCRHGARDLAAAPDGRVVATGCGDGLRVIDLLSLAATTLPLDSALFNDLVGLSPNGEEACLRRTGRGATVSNPLLAALELATGAPNNQASSCRARHQVLRACRCGWCACVARRIRRATPPCPSPASRPPARLRRRSPRRHRASLRRPAAG